MENTIETRDDFMSFFRDPEKMKQLAAKEREEIFSHILQGSSDLTQELFEYIFEHYKITHLKINDSQPKEDFMEFFRDDEKLAQLSADDREEVFSHVLSSKDELTKELIESIFSDFGIGHLTIEKV